MVKQNLVSEAAQEIGQERVVYPDDEGKIKYINLCEKGRELWRFARGMNRNAELHGKEFREIVLTSMDHGQRLLNHIKSCEDCNK